jgi:intracellular multiplication protein IcmL
MSQDPGELVRLRNNFYRDNYRRAMVILLCSILMNVVLATGATFLALHKPEPRYFATNRDGTIIQLLPLNQPLHSDADIRDWATRAALAAMSYDFLNYRTQLQASAQYFTDDAFTTYLKALKDSGNMELLTTKRLVSQPFSEGVPIVLAQGMIGDRYAWKVKVPIAVRYVSSSQTQISHYMVTMTITRVSTLDTPQGILIASFVTDTTGTSPGGPADNV